MRYFVEHLTYPSSTVEGRTEHVYVSRALPNIDGSFFIDGNKTIANIRDRLGEKATYHCEMVEKDF